MKATGMVTNNLKAFFQKGRQLKYKKDEIVLSPDVRPQGIYFIEQGFVKVYSISNRGEEYVHIVYKPGEIFPLVWALKDRRYDIFYQAINDCQLRRVSKSDFLEFIKSNTSAAYSLLEQLADQLGVHINRVDNLEHRHANERVAHRLLGLARRFGKRYGNKITIEAPFTHQLIADSINLTRESVSREVEKLEKQNIIEYSEHKIVIKNPKRLEQELERTA